MFYSFFGDYILHDVTCTNALLQFSNLHCIVNQINLGMAGRGGDRNTLQLYYFCL